MATALVGAGLSTGSDDDALILQERYVLLQPLGSGGLGTVFEARDLELDRAVAIKILHRTRGRATELERLAREANAMARINHPNVVKVFDVGHYDGLAGHRKSRFSTTKWARNAAFPHAREDKQQDIGFSDGLLEGDDLRLRDLPREGMFVVMELVRGTDLEAWLRVPRPRAQILDVYIQAAQGLAAAHRQGVLHRDFKPSNVLLARDGTARVTDFGLASAFDPTGDTASMDEPEPSPDAEAWVIDSLTKTGLTVGTPAYMAPEQHRGRKLDARTDQYAFFLAFAEALYGDRPVHGATLEALLASKLELELPKRNDLPRALRRAIRRGLAPDPTQRFGSMEDVLAALRPRQGWRRGVPMFAWAGAAVACALAWMVPADPSRAPVAEASAATQPIALPESSDSVRSTPARWEPSRVAFADRPISPGGDARERQSILATFAYLSETGPMSVDLDGRRERIESVRAQARAFGDPALIAEADLFYAITLANMDRIDEAKRAAENAFRLAEESREHGVAARAASMCLGFQAPYSDPWNRWARQAELQIDLAGGEPHTEMALAEELGFAAMDTEKWEEALLHWQRVIEIADAAFGEAHPAMASALSMLAHVYGALEQPEQEVEALRGSLEIMQTVLPDELDVIADTHIELGLALMKVGEPVEAVNQVEEGMKLLESVEPNPFRQDAVGHANWAMGMLMQDLGRHEDAVQKLQGVLPHLDEELPYNGMSVHRAIAESQLEMGKRRAAIRSLREALKFVDPDAPEWPERIEIRAMLADLEAER